MSEQARNPAIQYSPDAYDASGERYPVVGRTAAGEGFLRGLTRYSVSHRLYCFAASPNHFDDFKTRVKNLSNKNLDCRWIPWTQPHDLEHAGCLYIPEPVLAGHAWNRRHGNQRAYSLCGITHTTAHNETVDAIGALLTAPVQHWDAVICTSQVVKDTVTMLLSDWAQYLAERTGGRIQCPIELPVIPLGVDCDAFSSSLTTQQTRESLRAQMSVGKDDVVVLYMGRLSFNHKANPFPMLSGLEKAARTTGKRVHLVQAGWFENDINAQAFANAARQFAPSVNILLADGRQEFIRKNIWHAADIFTSLVDNIQETFGISPIEAMAAGLPVVVSDWNGYRETVQEGITGFRIPTCMPASGAGEDLAMRFNTGNDAYRDYLTYTSATVSVDVESCTQAYVRLIQDPELRRRMGDAGRSRARERFDWQVVIAAYQELWDELENRRRHSAENAPWSGAPPHHPLRQDPFRLFANYSTGTINDDARISMTPGANLASLKMLRGSELFQSAMPLLLSEDECREILMKVSAVPALRVGDLTINFGEARRARVLRTIGWLAKTGVLAVSAPIREGSSH